MSALSGRAINLNENGVAMSLGANSQSECDAVVGVPTANQDEPPLTFEEVQCLEEGDVLYILDSDENEWARYLFVCFEEEGFTVKRRVPSSSKEESFENVLIQCEGDDDLPVIYRADNTPAPPLNGCNEVNETTDHMLSDFEYKPDSKLFIVDDGGALVPFTILQFDPKTTKTTLQDPGGMITSFVVE